MLNTFMENLPTYAVSLGFFLLAIGAVIWASAKLVKAYADKDPKVNEWDTRAKQLQEFSDRYAQIVEWLVAAGAKKWTGAEKLAEVEKRIKEVEGLLERGEYLKAVAAVSGEWQSALSKVEAAKKTALGESNGKASTGEEAEETDPLANTPASEDCK